MARFQTPADVHVRLFLPPGQGDSMWISVTPHRANVQPPGNGSVITWHLTGHPATIDGLKFGSNGIQMDAPPWDTNWGVPQSVDAVTYELEVDGNPPTGESFKYTVLIEWNGGSAQIDPEIEFDPDS